MKRKEVMALFYLEKRKGTLPPVGSTSAEAGAKKSTIPLP
jgi:hypothetical protein